MWLCGCRRLYIIMRCHRGAWGPPRAGRQGVTKTHACLARVADRTRGWGQAQRSGRTAAAACAGPSPAARRTRKDRLVALNASDSIAPAAVHRASGQGRSIASRAARSDPGGTHALTSSSCTGLVSAPPAAARLQAAASPARAANARDGRPHRATARAARPRVSCSRRSPSPEAQASRTASPAWNTSVASDGPAPRTCSGAGALELTAPAWPLPASAAAPIPTSETESTAPSSRSRLPRRRCCPLCTRMLDSCTSLCVNPPA